MVIWENDWIFCRSLMCIVCVFNCTTLQSKAVGRRRMFTFHIIQKRLKSVFIFIYSGLFRFSLSFISNFNESKGKGPLTAIDFLLWFMTYMHRFFFVFLKRVIFNILIINFPFYSNVNVRYWTYVLHLTLYLNDGQNFKIKCFGPQK